MFRRFEQKKCNWSEYILDAYRLFLHQTNSIKFSVLKGVPVLQSSTVYYKSVKINTRDLFIAKIKSLFLIAVPVSHPHHCGQYSSERTFRRDPGRIAISRSKKPTPSMNTSFTRNANDWVACRTKGNREGSSCENGADHLHSNRGEIKRARTVSPRRREIIEDRREWSSNIRSTVLPLIYYHPASSYFLLNWRINAGKY